MYDNIIYFKVPNPVFEEHTSWTVTVLPGLDSWSVFFHTGNSRRIPPLLEEYFLTVATPVFEDGHERKIYPLPLRPEYAKQILPLLWKSAHSQENFLDDLLEMLSPLPPNTVLKAPDGKQIRKKFDALLNKAGGLTKSEVKGFVCSPNFRSITADGIDYTLTDGQAEVVKKVYEAHQEGIKELSEAEIFSDYPDDRKLPRVRDRFKKSPAWGTLIINGSQRGMYRLNIEF